MNVRINGEPAAVEDGVTVTELLARYDVKMPEMVSVELNGEILPRNGFSRKVVKDGDVIEFLYFMGGGR